MPSLISSEIQQSVTSLFVDLHDTFAKDITVFKNGQAIAISSSPTYNSFYGNRSSAESIQYETVSQTFKARIYFTKVENAFLSNTQGAHDSSEKIILPQGSVKIVVNREAYLFIKEARIIEFDGSTYSITSSADKEGLFELQFYEFYLIPLNE